MRWPPCLSFVVAHPWSSTLTGSHIRSEPWQLCTHQSWASQHPELQETNLCPFSMTQYLSFCNSIKLMETWGSKSPVVFSFSLSKFTLCIMFTDVDFIYNFKCCICPLNWPLHFYVITPFMSRESFKLKSILFVPICKRYLFPTHCFQPVCVFNSIVKCLQLANFQ